MKSSTDEEILLLARSAFGQANILLGGLSIRRFPGETILIAEVGASDFSRAMGVAGSLDEKIPDGFVTVRVGSGDKTKVDPERTKTLSDPRVNELIVVLNERSRTTEQLPSLKYIRDATHTTNIAVSQRHHLIFGRRGVGKTALMLESKKYLENKGAITFWINVQVIRNLSAIDAFMNVAARLSEIPGMIHGGRRKDPRSVELSRENIKKIRLYFESQKKYRDISKTIIPEIQYALNLFCKEIDNDLYLFIDDIHYLPMKDQPMFLDMVHSITRDSNIWIKAAGIRHQSRWFSDSPPTGLQIGHDAAEINLDITLEQPSRAREFLVDILRAYMDDVKIRNVHEIVSRDAVDRLVLASGGVPRDFLLLAATGIQVARNRANARTIGVQDINSAAGNIAETKIQELSDDAASSIGHAKPRLELLKQLKIFLLDENKCSYFRIGFQDKETNPSEYEVLQSLMDLRLIHLINASISDERHAGRRSEVYMLDLSQFSGTRFKRNLKVLDFLKDSLVLKNTGTNDPPRIGNTPIKLLGILRRAPQFHLTPTRGPT